jgi:hypothetical protein
MRKSPDSNFFMQGSKFCLLVCFFSLWAIPQIPVWRYYLNTWTFFGAAIILVVLQALNITHYLAHRRASRMKAPVTD